MLKFEHPSVLGLDASNVFLAILGGMHYFLTFDGKLALPGSLPLSFTFPPRITDKRALMRPVPHSEPPTLRDDWALAGRAHTGEPRHRFRARTIDESKLHEILDSNWAEP
jgi:hypothetical protein